MVLPSTSSPTLNHSVYDYISLEGNLTATLGTNDLALEKTVRAFPNPTNGVFNITLPKATKEVSTQLYNVNGALISSQKHLVNNDNIELNITDKPVGIYFLKVLGDYEAATIKIVKKY